jgi:hypothetical protein
MTVDDQSAMTDCVDEIAIFGSFSFRSRGGATRDMIRGFPLREQSFFGRD